MSKLFNPSSKKHSLHYLCHAWIIFSSTEPHHTATPLLGIWNLLRVFGVTRIELRVGSAHTAWQVAEVTIRPFVPWSKITCNFSEFTWPFCWIKGSTFFPGRHLIIPSAVGVTGKAGLEKVSEAVTEQLHELIPATGLAVWPWASVILSLFLFAFLPACKMHSLHLMTCSLCNLCWISQLHTKNSVETNPMILPGLSALVSMVLLTL